MLSSLGPINICEECSPTVSLGSKKLHGTLLIITVVAAFNCPIERFRGNNITPIPAAACYYWLFRVQLFQGQKILPTRPRFPYLSNSSFPLLTALPCRTERH